ncbi:MAG: hypothetical protein HY721_33505 [Planctomycetes bacterium]|nr:hypothetical protein [Planctomycetota bacterium]
MFPEKLEYIQILIMVLAVGGLIVQLLYRSFVRPVARPPAGAPRPAAPARGIKDFLEEIRRAAREAAGEEEAPGRGGAPGEGGVPREGGAPRRAEGPAPEAAREAPPAAPRPAARRERPQAPRREEPPQRERLPEAADERPEKTVQEHIDELWPEPPQPAPREPAPGEDVRTRRLVGSAEAPGSTTRSRRAAVLSGLGLDLGHAILAQVVLGPPRCRERRPGPGRGWRLPRPGRPGGTS